MTEKAMTGQAISLVRLECWPQHWQCELEEQSVMEIPPSLLGCCCANTLSIASAWMKYF